MADVAARSPELIDLYLAEIRARHLLSRDEERDLARRALDGCETSRRDLVEANLGFVVKVAKSYRSMGVPFEDLLNEGNLGLIEAARRFDPANGTRFITYAIWWIRKSILEALNRDSGVVRVPGCRRRRAREARDAERQLRARLGRQPERHEVAAYLERSPDEIEELLRPLPAPVRLDDDDARAEGVTIAESIVDDSDPGPEAWLERDEAARLVDAALGALSERERDVVRGRYGLAGEPPLTLNELGTRLGLSRERVRQIEAKALGRLRRRIGGRRRPARLPRAS